MDATVLVDAIGESVAQSVDEVVLPLVRRQVEGMRGDIESAVKLAIEERVQLQIRATVAEQVARLPQARDGKDGRDGFLTAATDWAPGVHPMHTMVTHRGGLWQATRTTVDEPGFEHSGWLCLSVGIEDVHSAQSEDGREVTHILRTSDGVSHEYVTRHAVYVHRGLWRDDVVYQMGEEVATDGSTWRARVDSPAGPPPGDDWVLAAQRGPRGKPGKEGEPGRDGEPGTDGEKGLRGETGLPGIRGDRGAKGEQGERGQRGARGEKGLAVIGVDQVDEHSFRLQMSDGSHSSVMRMPAGPRGAPGISLGWRGQFAGGESYSIGDIVKFDSALWFCRESTSQSPQAASTAWEHMNGGQRKRSGGGAGATGTAVADFLTANVTTLNALIGMKAGDVARVGDYGAGQPGTALFNGFAWIQVGGSGALPTQAVASIAAMTALAPLDAGTHVRVTNDGNGRPRMFVSDGTGFQPVSNESFAVANITARDSLNAYPGDFAEVADDGTGSPATYQWDGDSYNLEAPAAASSPTATTRQQQTINLAPNVPLVVTPSPAGAIASVEVFDAAGNEIHPAQAMGAGDATVSLTSLVAYTGARVVLTVDEA